jgi:hypothetical protein
MDTIPMKYQWQCLCPHGENRFFNDICQYYEQHAMEIIEKLCSDNVQWFQLRDLKPDDNKQEHEQQQLPREKRIGWTISV